MKQLIPIALLLSLHVHASDSPQRYPYQRCFEVAAGMHNVALDLLLAVAATESNWDANARSKSQAHGIMQIQWPGTAKHLGVNRVGELYNPCLNISLGAKYLEELINRYGGNETYALAAYNYGPGRISESAGLPAGAQKYADTVARHRQRIAAGLVPEALKPQSQKVLVTFDSESRANRLAKRLEARIEGATISVSRRQSAYAVVLEVGQAGLTVGDHVTLNNLGWAP